MPTNLNTNLNARRYSVLGVSISQLTWDTAIAQIEKWGAQHESRYVCICNVHSVITANRDLEFNVVIRNADMATPDGAPIAWALRKIGKTAQDRINGPDLMWRYLEAAEKSGQKPYFYGGSASTLKKLLDSIQEQFPRLQIAGAHAPPFRELTELEERTNMDEINQSGAHVVFVGLGCPKQEKWMAAHCGRISAVMIGVGAAFDYHAGTIKRAPLSWQHHGFEWLYRLLTEPRRLFARYLITNTLFILAITKQLLLAKNQKSEV